MIKRFFAAAIAAMTCTAALAGNSIWEPWKEIKIPVGNDKDGFTDFTTGTASLSDPAKTFNLVHVPYIVYIPEQNRVLLHCGSFGWPSKGGRFIESYDYGKTWSEPFGKIGGTGLTYYGNGILSVNDGCRRSEDYGKTWKNYPRKSYHSRFGSYLYGWDRECVMPNTSGQHIIRSVNTSRHFHTAEGKTVALIQESFDAGKTWSEPRGIPEFMGANEVSIIENGKGALVAAIRAQTMLGPSQDQSARLEVSISYDKGKTWSAPKVVAGNGRHHPSLVLLPDGKIVMSYVVRMGYQRQNGKYHYGIEAVVSHDGGVTWDTKHRYILSRYSHDATVFDKQQNRRVPLEQWYPAPQSTSTIYMKKTGELITVYGTAQNISFRDGRATLPRQIGIVRWKLLDNFSGKKVTHQAVSTQKAHQEVRECPYFAVNYMAITGKPDCGWISNYPKAALQLTKDGFLRLDQAALISSTLKIHGTEELEFMGGPVAIKMVLRVPEQKSSAGRRMTFYIVPGTGEEKYAFALFVFGNGTIKTSMGYVDTPIPAGSEFTLEMHLDPLAQRGRLWLNGKLAIDKEWKPAYRKPEDAAICYFGAGTGDSAGFMDVKEIKVGRIER